MELDYSAFKDAFEKHKITQEKEPIELLLEDQYKEAYDILEDAYNSGLYVGIVGPVGCGKTALTRKFAYDHAIGFSWLTFSDLIRPATLIGNFEPNLVFKNGFSLESFTPGPLTLAAVYGQIFFANELNRGEEFVLNTLLDVMEEKRLYIPQLKTWLQVDNNFFFITAMNPSDLRGTRVLPQALKDRIRVWINLTYPSQEIETKIVMLNCPELKLRDETLHKIVEIVSETRNHHEIVQPASIRASIGYAKLLAQRIKRLGLQEPNNQQIFEVGKLILNQAINVSPGVDANILVERLLKTKLGV
jgi:MoxR-like ATPase